MAVFEIPKYEFDINLTQEQIKNKIDKLVSIKKYSLVNKNDVINKYELGKLSGLTMVQYSILLSKNSETSTKIKLECYPVVGNTSHSTSFFKSHLDKLIEDLTTNSANKPKKNGLLFRIIFWILVIISAILFFILK